MQHEWLIPSNWINKAGKYQVILILWVCHAASTQLLWMGCTTLLCTAALISLDYKLYEFALKINKWKFKRINRTTSNMEQLCFLRDGWRLHSVILRITQHRVVPVATTHWSKPATLVFHLRSSSFLFPFSTIFQQWVHMKVRQGERKQEKSTIEQTNTLTGLCRFFFLLLQMKRNHISVSPQSVSV